jgi:transcriptional regulator with XRE-family HTH domain
MAKKFRDLRARMPEASRARAEEKARALMEALPLAELRQARRLSQEQLAELLSIRQPAVAKLEKRTDMYISTLRRVIEAMGGELEIRAHFPEGDVQIDQFEALDETSQVAG